MSKSPPCSYCGKTSFVRDNDSDVQQFDQFDAQIGGIDGPQGTFIHVGTAGSGNLYSYRERKLFVVQNLINKVTNHLGLSSKSNEVRSMLSTITEGEFGQGELFHELIGTCTYVVMRKVDRPLPMAEVASSIGCDVYEFGENDHARR